MATFQCKMCGGILEISTGMSVGECQYCGTLQTLPRLDSDKKRNLYERAGHFRRNNDYDKAISLYEKILEEGQDDAEAYWSLVLCKYGIEYVVDASSHKRIPTVNRAQFTSVFMDEDYKAALKYADASQKEIYEAEARKIDEIQKGILAISEREAPFDIFICYKESDSSGRRTPDSVLANDLYHQLTQEGFKVFFSRITLEDKLGQEYEPYIFAALNSAKVMVVLGTRPEYFNAVWVKNEWSRYLALIKSGAKKVLIPAYRDMDPYDLPEEFSHLQAQDMSKLGFMQDLIRGIKKIIGSEQPKKESKETVSLDNVNGNKTSLLKRIFLFLEDKDWKSADEYCERVLDIDPECARAYLGKMMAEYHVGWEEGLKECSTPLENSGSYKKILRYADEALREKIVSYNQMTIERNEQERIESVYIHGCNAMAKGEAELKSEEIAKLLENVRQRISYYCQAIELFKNMMSYKDVTERISVCESNKESLEKYAICIQTYKQAYEAENLGTKESLKEAIEKYRTIQDYKDVEERLITCTKNLKKMIAHEIAKKIYFFICVAIWIIVYVLIAIIGLNI